MAEYLANVPQDVALNSPILFTASIPCNKGYVYHEDETGIFILRGITNNCFARYRVTYNGNISIPEEGDVTPIALAIAVNGEPRFTSRAIYTPVAVDEYGNVTSTAIITVPKGCCFSLSVRYVDGTTDEPAIIPTPVINVQNSNLVIDRVA
ncbi:hypothetical protein SAMN05660484_00039 [Eubacterium ruminantium]|uniref:hypothetical protein n=1 Tax=Eubacterium ruminantium TaxID=42322 RepID=UPI0008717A02|nr:hypothetical protein [Eubacterium ruminantium]SCW26678.1 hypothetical protein SAMN05660484_00039 [Eubacterium ruminantium]SDM17079.1 hypothetical protein SAMN04490370_101264 [Eubacterium ruminantium]